MTIHFKMNLSILSLKHLKIEVKLHQNCIVQYSKSNQSRSHPILPSFRMQADLRREEGGVLRAARRERRGQDDHLQDADRRHAPLRRGGARQRQQRPHRAPESAKVGRLRIVFWREIQNLIWCFWRQIQSYSKSADLSGTARNSTLSTRC